MGATWDNDLAHTLRDAVRDAMRIQGVTFEVLAKRSGIAQSTLARLLTAQNGGTLATWDALLSALGLRVQVSLVALQEVA